MKEFYWELILSIAANELMYQRLPVNSYVQLKTLKLLKNMISIKTNFKKQVNKKVVDAQKAVNLFKRTRTVATHRKAQRAVNLILFPTQVT